ncbi:DUF2567 domain-containing protein [Verrucosispora sp. TAA-831]|uniref:DUF2567 domain-containing protein n=1 Tax=Verrucosispora sp. TAA-831 TaxID=3422227 RepID=UPI003D6E9976
MATPCAASDGNCEDHRVSPETPAAEPPAPVPPAVPQPPPGPPRRPARTLRVGALTALVMGLLGVPLGLLWAALAPATPVIKSAPGQAVYGQAQPEQPIAADGWFSLLGLGFGVLAALVVWLVLRHYRGPVGLVVVVTGGLAAALVAWQVGRRIGLGGYERLLEGAPDGTRLAKPADLRAGGIEMVLGVLPVPHGNLLLPAFGAAVAYTLLAGWSRWPSLRPEPEPDPAWFVPPAGFPGGVARPPLDHPGGPVPPSAGHPGGTVGYLGGTAQPPVSSESAAPWPAPPAAPAPPAPGAAEPPRG